MSLEVRDIDSSAGAVAAASPRIWPWVALLLSVACTYRPEPPDRVIACTGTGPGACPGDLFCVPQEGGKSFCCKDMACSDPTGGSGGGPGGAGGVGGVGGAAGYGPPLDAGPLDAPEDSVVPGEGGVACADSPCSAGQFRCQEGKLETCVSLNGCGSWGGAMACPDGQICMGAAPTARCECPAPPAGCENGGGTRCESASVALTCTTNEAKCVVGAPQRVTCPASQPCTGAFPGAHCANCPAPPTECMGRTGRFCNGAGQIVECVSDPQSTCISLGAARACESGKTCQGAFPDAACACRAPNVGASCSKCGGVVNCDGSCSVPDPPNFGFDCGNCGGKYKCDGTCSVPNPPGWGQTCGNCKGTTKCDGTCSVPNQPRLGMPCGCGGTLRCDGSCDRQRACTLADDLLLFWKLDEGAGQAAFDSSGNRLTGTYVGTLPIPAVVSNSVSARAFGVAEPPDAVVLAGLPSVLRPPALTISVFYQYPTTTVRGEGAELVSLGDNHLLRLTSSGFRAAKRTRFMGRTNWFACDTDRRRLNGRHLDGGWHHAAATIDEARVLIYFDGEEVCSEPIESSMLYDVPGDFTVGRHGNGERTANFEGNLDEVRVYGRVLAPSEVQRLAHGEN